MKNEKWLRGNPEQMNLVENQERSCHVSFAGELAVHASWFYRLTLSRHR